MATKNPRWPPRILFCFDISTLDRGDFPRIIEIALLFYIAILFNLFKNCSSTNHEQSQQSRKHISSLIYRHQHQSKDSQKISSLSNIQNRPKENKSNTRMMMFNFVSFQALTRQCRVVQAVICTNSSRTLNQYIDFFFTLVKIQHKNRHVNTGSRWLKLYKSGTF